MTSYLIPQIMLTIQEGEPEENVIDEEKLRNIINLNKRKQLDAYAENIKNVKPEENRK